MDIDLCLYVQIYQIYILPLLLAGNIDQNWVDIFCFIKNACSAKRKKCPNTTETLIRPLKLWPSIYYLFVVFASRLYVVGTRTMWLVGQ